MFLENEEAMEYEGAITETEWFKILYDCIKLIKPQEVMTSR